MHVSTLEKISLFDHQREAVEFLLKNNGCGALFHEIGCGKTRTALEVYSGLKKSEPNLRLLTICPISLIEAAWGEDIKKFTDFSYGNLRKRIKGNEDILLLNYEALISAKNILFIRKLVSNGPWMIALDESSKIKNHNAKITKTLLSIRSLFKYRLVMTGIAAPNCEAEYWSQINFVKDRVLHPKFYPFRNYYFHLERDHRGKKEEFHGRMITKDMARKMFSTGWHYAMTDSRRSEMMRRIKPLCHYALKKDCLDLPDQVDEYRDIYLSPKHIALYKQMERDLIIEIKGSMIVAQVALTKIMKLRQITSGFAIDDSGESQELAENPKLKELSDILDQAGNQQAIIWGNFHFEIEKIKALLGDQAATLYGKTKDKDSVIKDFKEGRTRYLIAHPHSAGHGLTFTNCSLQIFFSLDYSFEYYEQARGRTHRAGQVNKCTYVHLIAKDTIDEDILAVLKRKGDANEILQRMLK